MALHLYPVVWEKSLSLDRSRTNRFLDSESLPKLEDLRANPSFLYSAQLRQNLQESRKAFLNLSLCSNEIEANENNKEDEKQEVKRIAARKISYKCKRVSSVYRKTGRTTTLRGNSVAELASKFDKLVAEKKSILDDPKFARLVQRVNSQRSNQDGVKLIKKPSVKMKHSFKTDEKTLYISRRPSLVRKISIKKLPKTCGVPNDKSCVRAKISYLESPQHLVKNESDVTHSTIRRLPSIPKKPLKTPNNVRATIDLFERQTNKNEKPTKPKVPEKKIDAKTIELITKNRKLIDQTRQKPTRAKLNNEQKTTTPEITNNKTDFDVQILNIPIARPKKCESNYETFNFKIRSKQHELIDESLEMKPNNSFLWRRSSEKFPPIYNHITFESEPNLVKLEDSNKFCQENESRPTSIIDSNTNDVNDVYELSTEIPTISVNEEDLYDFVDPTLHSSQLDDTKCSPVINMPKLVKKKMAEPEEKIYEELIIHKSDNVSHNYEICQPAPKYEDLEQNDGYEAVNPILTHSNENIYEVLPVKRSPPPLLPKRQEEPLPPRPPSKNSTIRNNTEVVSNCYESIYNASSGDVPCDNESNYESIYGCQITVDWGGSGSNRDSLVSSDQQSNSLYGRSMPSWTEEVLNYKTGSVSSSERSDDWIDISDNEEANVNPGFILVREKTKISKKTSGWSQQLRERRAKSPRKHTVSQGDSDSDHHYESLFNGEDESHYDSDDSFDSVSDYSNDKVNMHDSGVDMEHTQLPEPPNNQTYVLTRLAASAGKHMKRLRRNWSLTKNDITKSLSRMTKKKSRTDLHNIEKNKDQTPPPLPDKNFKSRLSIPTPSNNTNISPEIQARDSQSSLNSQTYQNVQYTRSSTSGDSVGENIYEKSKNKKGFLKKFRRSMSLSAESASDLTQDLNKPKSTFYLTEDIDIDDNQMNEVEKRKNSLSPTMIKAKNKSSPVRPRVPPPPLPTANSNTSDILDTKAQHTTEMNLNKHTFLESNTVQTKTESKRSTSWYAECGLFKNPENVMTNLPKRPNTFWYAEVGLYQTGHSTPSTSSAENSGNGAVTIKNQINANNIDSSEEYYNIQSEENDYYNESIDSSSSHETKLDKSYSTLSADMQLLLQEEPLYQFYDAALSDTVCKEGTTDLDYDDGYEEVGGQLIMENTTRPSAMELISPNKNNFSMSRTFWCEIPEVQQSTVLSTLSIHHKKIQEAKFEMMTSEASYLNSLNVLTNHFIKNLCDNEWLTSEDREILFGKIPAVKNCSEKLLQDLEICWQDSILLNDICKVINKHSEENFYVYVSFCENQTLLDRTLRKLKNRGNFHETLKQLEASPTCHALTLYSFLMLPMQRITRWPLLLDAYIKRLSPQDTDYLYCQCAIATINKILNQCNEAARKKERETELKEIASQLDFGKLSPIEIVSSSRWVVKAAPVTQMLMRGDDIKLTFGKRFSKVPLFLFLFNDLFLVTKYRSTEDNYLVLHYCPRNMVDINVEALYNFPIKDSQGRHLLFLTILENQDDKLVELLLSCNTESEKERWISAIIPPKSEDPNETLYECWDCPQVTAIHNYSADQPDELPLSRGDIINVTRKMADGWYHGERLRDGLAGWFPSNYVEDIANQHVRARNLKQRYRLLAFSENYLKSK